MFRVSTARRPSGGPSGLMLALKSRIWSRSSPARWANSRRFPPCLHGHRSPRSAQRSEGQHERRHDFDDLADGAERVAGGAADLAIDIGRQGRASRPRRPPRPPAPRHPRRPQATAARTPAAQTAAQRGGFGDRRWLPVRSAGRRARGPCGRRSPQRPGQAASSSTAGQSVAGRQRGQRREFHQQHAHDRHHAHRADVAVLHDLQDSLPRSGN